MRRIVLRDSTLTGGLATGGFDLSVARRVEILSALDRIGVREAEIVAPQRVAEDLRVAAVVAGKLRLRTAGLIDASSAKATGDIEAALDVLDRIDLLMPLSERDRPAGDARKISKLLDLVDRARTVGDRVGVGFPEATRASPLFLLEVAGLAGRAGVDRITLYDSNGGAEPFTLHQTLAELITEIEVPVFFQAGNDLGLALANAWAAVLAGVDGLIVQSGGLGVNAGGACLEQVVALLDRQDVETGVDRAGTEDLARLVARLAD